MCVCVREREREGERACVRACVCAYVSACVGAWVGVSAHARARVCVCVCVCVWYLLPNSRTACVRFDNVYDLCLLTPAECCFLSKIKHNMCTCCFVQNSLRLCCAFYGRRCTCACWCKPASTCLGSVAWSPSCPSTWKPSSSSPPGRQTPWSVSSTFKRLCDSLGC